MLNIRFDDEIELRVLQEDHAEELFALVDSSRKYLREWLPWLDDNKSLEDTQEFIYKSLVNYEAGDCFNAGVWYHGRLAGVIGFHPPDWRNGRTSIGYWLGESYQGQGIMTRACKALIGYLFDELGLHRIEILCAVENRKSQAIPERLGFTSEAVLREAERLYEGYVDLIMYSMLEQEWDSRGGLDE